MAGGDIDLTLGFSANPAERDSQNFWRKQEKQVIGFQNISRVAMVGFAGAVGAGFSALKAASEDSIEVKRNLDQLNQSVHDFQANIGRQLNMTGMLGTFNSVVGFGRKAFDSFTDMAATAMSGGMADIGGINQAIATSEKQDKLQKSIRENAKLSLEYDRQRADLAEQLASSVRGSSEPLKARLAVIDLETRAAIKQVQTNDALSQQDREARKSEIQEIDLLKRKVALRKDEAIQADIRREREDSEAKMREERGALLAEQAIKRQERAMEQVKATESLDNELQSLRESLAIEKLRASGGQEMADNLERQVRLKERLRDIDRQDISAADKARLSQGFINAYSSQASIRQPQNFKLSTNFSSDVYGSIMSHALSSPAQSERDTQKNILKANTEAVELLRKIERQGSTGTYGA
mgnify:CR=1 FL=1